MSTRFDELGLHPSIVQTVAELGYETPTPIQEKIIPTLLTGRDAVGQAQTGTGKTAAFALPMLEKIKAGRHGVQGLVLAPTRELAMQVADSISEYGRARRVRAMAFYGGQAYGRQFAALAKGVDIVVGTPGRMLDLMRRNAMDLSGVKSLVLDEADEMLSMGFIDDIETILKATPEERQTALFSATMPREILRICKRYLNDPEFCTIERGQLTAPEIEQRGYLVNPREKLAALSRILEMEDLGSTLIFVRTRQGTGELASALSTRGFAAEALSGDLTQEARQRVLERFRSGKIKMLVATDVAARGLDIDDISHVINFDPPQDPEVFVHRVGRTGRAGKTGIAINLVTPGDGYLINRIEGYTKQRVVRTEIPTEEEIIARREEKLVEKMMVWLKRGRCHREKEMTLALVEQGFDPIEIASAALRLVQRESGQMHVEKLSPVVKPERDFNRRKPFGKKNFGPGRGNRDNRGGRDGYGGRDNRGPRQGYGSRPGNAPARKREHGKESGMACISLSTGRDSGLTVSHVVGSIAHFADIPGRALGRISIEDGRTLVDVPQELVDKVLKKCANYKVNRRPVKVRLHSGE